MTQFQQLSETDMTANPFEKCGKIEGGEIIYSEICKIRFAQNTEIFEMYISSSEIITQLSLAALALTVFFRERIMGDGNVIRFGRLMLASWICFIVSIVSGGLYPYVAVAYLDKYTINPARSGLLYVVLDPPARVYGAMLFSFFLGIGFFFFAAWSGLAKRRER